MIDEERGDLTIGTTRRGIGPAYADKAARLGIQTSDLLDQPTMERKLGLVVDETNRALERHGAAPFSLGSLIDRASTWAERFGPLIVDQVPLVDEALTQDRFILLEGQLGAMRDLDWGTYPYVTSSTTIAGGGAVGGGVPPMRIERVMGVVKAYTSAVGTGPVPTELVGKEADELREQGAEYGATTGRPRRVGWFDAVASRYARMLNQFTGIAITKLDVLDQAPMIKLCTAYQVDGRTWDTVPATPLMERASPVYEQLPGWRTNIADCRRWDELPGAARDYVERIEQLVGAPVAIISVGPGRHQTIERS